MVSSVGHTSVLSPGSLPIMDSHWRRLSLLLKRCGQHVEHFQSVIEEHQNLIHAIERRDAHSAGTLMGPHIENGRSTL